MEESWENYASIFGHERKRINFHPMIVWVHTSVYILGPFRVIPSSVQPIQLQTWQSSPSRYQRVAFQHQKHEIDARIIDRQHSKGVQQERLNLWSFRILRITSLSYNLGIRRQLQDNSIADFSTLIGRDFGVFKVIPGSFELVLDCKLLTFHAWGVQQIG